MAVLLGGADVCTAAERGTAIFGKTVVAEALFNGFMAEGTPVCCPPSGGVEDFAAANRRIS